MQNIYSFLSLVAFYLLFTSNIQASSKSLFLADSLFNSKEYTKSYRLYDSLLQSGKASKTMLLKMAYTKEGLNDYASALYYLSLCNKLYPDEDVSEKIESLANKNNVTGHKHSDSEIFLNTYKNWKQRVVYILICLLVLTIVFQLIQFIRKKKINIGALVWQAILCILCFLALHLPLEKKKGIIISDKSLIMSKPTAGAKLIENSTKGHKIQILEEEDIWYKIEWKDSEAYIRKDNVRAI